MAGKAMITSLELDEGAAFVLDMPLGYKGDTQTRSAVVSRLINWFASQPLPVRMLVIGDIPADAPRLRLAATVDAAAAWLRTLDPESRRAVLDAICGGQTIQGAAVLFDDQGKPRSPQQRPPAAPKAKREG